MSKSDLKLNISIRDILACTCKKCRKKIRDLVKESITDSMVDQVVGIEPEGGV